MDAQKANLLDDEAIDCFDQNELPAGINPFDYMLQKNNNFYIVTICFIIFFKNLILEQCNALYY